MKIFVLGVIFGISIFNVRASAQVSASKDCCLERKGISKQSQYANVLSQDAMNHYHNDIIAKLPASAVSEEDIRKALCGNEFAPSSTQIQTQINEARATLQPEMNSTWVNLSGWKIKTTPGFGRSVANLTVTNLQCIFSTYGAKSPNTDFAEAIRVYRFKPAILQLQCPEKYNYLRENVFNGKEFTNQNHCGV